jgi:hypothetical protein
MSRMFMVTIIVLVAFTLSFSQDLVLEPYGVSPAAVKADTVGDDNYLGIKDRVSTGLLNVGVETKVYLMATFEDSSITSLTWTLIENAGSATLSSATKVDDASEIVTFVPDVVGTYKVSVSEGSFADTVVVNAAKFKGVEGAAPNCSNCHSATFSEFSETGHSHFLTNALNGAGRSGESCLGCHTTGFDALADNDGFDDFDFAYPANPGEGVADSLAGVYPDAMVRANIQCESCHGPGSGHIENSSDRLGDSRMVVSIESDACAACHDDDHYHVYPSQWEASNHAALERPYTRASCAQCHNGKGFIDYVDGGKVGLPEDVDANYNITCATCHDPHDATNENQLRTMEVTLPNGDVITEGGKGKLCMNCHNSRRILPDRILERMDVGDTPEPHHGPQAEMLTTMNVETYGLDLPTSPHLQAAEDACVDCHMYETGSHGEHDPETGLLSTSGMHSFAMVNQQGVDNVGSCSPCHAPFGEEFGDKVFYMNGNADHDGDGNVEGLQHEVEGLLEILHEALPKNLDGDIEIQDSTISFNEAAAIYNYFLVEEDRSMGIHNPAFTVSLLQASIDVATGVNSVDTRGFSPIEYELSQNYPNPFNPTTQINYSIKKAGKVEIRVYDVLGREVMTLVNEEMTPGKYTANFDASDLASGIYIYRIQAGTDFAAVKKMVLIK